MSYVKGAPNTFVDLSFANDGAPVGAFTHTPDASSAILYNHFVYSATGLPERSSLNTSGSRSSLVARLHDRRRRRGRRHPHFRSGSPSPSSIAPISSSSFALAAASASSSHAHTAAIAGGVVGGVVALLVIPTLFFLPFCRRPRPRAGASTVDPYTFPSPPDSALLPLMGELSGFLRPESRSMYSNTTATGPGPSPASSSRTSETKRELELKRRMEALQHEVAAHHLHHHLKRHRLPYPGRLGVRRRDSGAADGYRGAPGRAGRDGARAACDLRIGGAAGVRGGAVVCDRECGVGDGTRVVKTGITYEA